MNRKIIDLVIIGVLISAAMVFSGCVEKEVTPSTPATPPSETPTPTPKIQEPSDKVVLISKPREPGEKFARRWHPAQGGVRFVVKEWSEQRKPGFDVAVIKNGVVFAPFRPLREDLGLYFSVTEGSRVIYDPDGPALPPRYYGSPDPVTGLRSTRGTVKTTTWYSLSNYETVRQGEEVGAVSISFVVGSNIITINGEEHQIDAAPFRDRILYVPLKDFVEPFGFKVRFDTLTPKIPKPSDEVVLIFEPQDSETRLWFVVKEWSDQKKFGSDIAVMKNGVVFVSISESLLDGLRLRLSVLSFEGESEATRRLHGDEVSISFVPGSNIVTISRIGGGEKRQMEAAPFRGNGGLYVPLKDLVEPLGFKVRFE